MTTRKAPLLLLVLSVALVGCLSRRAHTPTPTVAPSATPTAAVPPSPTPAPVSPTATLIPLATVLPTLAAQLLPTAASAAAEAAGTTVVARHESEGTFAIAMLNTIALQPGHSYRLLVESASGIASFYGQWSTSAIGADGMLGTDGGLLDARTPAGYDIVPPVATVTRDWVYSASVQNKGTGSISLTIVDVTPGG